uniref:INO80 complex subunit B-like conserved region domain-containing protein n=1 Tax=Kalanchoe fedtschenkoi TaxID=63787 RepID=A0A7N0VH67_KALFE
MAELSSSRFEVVPSYVRKKRTLRTRPTETQSSTATQDKSLLPLASPFDDTTKPSCNDNTGPSRKESSQSRSKISVRTEGKMPNKKLKHDASRYMLYENEASRNGMVSQTGYQGDSGICNSSEPTNGFIVKSMNGDGHRSNCGSQQISEHLGTVVGGLDNENKVKRVKLKVGGVTHTIHGSTTPNVKMSGNFAESIPPLDGLRADRKGVTDDGRTYPLNKSRGLQGIPWTEFPKSEFSIGRSEFSMGRPGKFNPGKLGEKSEPVRKSKRAPKGRALDLAMEDEEEDDDEIRFLEKLRNSKSSIGHNQDGDDEESSRKRQKYSRVSEIGMGVASENMGNADEEQYNAASNCDLEVKFEGKSKGDLKRNSMLTARQRALQSGRSGPSSPDANLEFPNGLQPVPLKKKKDILSEKELLKKAEAAQKRRLQNEKAAQKSQEDAIRKILSQDSSKKKKEDQRKKRMEELAQEKAADAIKHQSDTVRVVMSPAGTVVSFGENCIPSIFTTKPPSYPPPRESCAGPSCTNPYKYRDSKSNLPLCSLKCYKAVRERIATESIGC